jgi:hypothetical protein
MNTRSRAPPWSSVVRGCPGSSRRQGLPSRGVRVPRLWVPAPAPPSLTIRRWRSVPAGQPWQPSSPDPPPNGHGQRPHPPRGLREEDTEWPRTATASERAPGGRPAADQDQAQHDDTDPGKGMGPTSADRGGWVHLATPRSPVQRRPATVPAVPRQTDDQRCGRPELRACSTRPQPGGRPARSVPGRGVAGDRGGDRATTGRAHARGRWLSEAGTGSVVPGRRPVVVTRLSRPRRSGHAPCSGRPDPGPMVVDMVAFFR